MATSQLTGREYAYVSITGPGTHEAVTERIGLKPSEAWNVGDVNPKNGRPRNFMRWELRSGLDDTHRLKEHIAILLTYLGAKSAEVRALWLEFDITLQCVGHFPPSRGPGLHFDRETIRQAANLGVAIDCDLYFVEDHGHDA